MDARMPAPLSAPATALLLVADPSARVLRDSVLRRYLADAGYAVAAAATTSNAVTYLQDALRPHVVVLDFHVPPGTAIPLLNVVGRNAALQRHHYILLSAWPIRRYSEDFRSLITECCAAVIYKPLDVTTLLGTVERAALQMPLDPT